MLGALCNEFPDPDCARNFSVLLTCRCRETLFSCLLESRVETMANRNSGIERKTRNVSEKNHTVPKGYILFKLQDHSKKTLSADPCSVRRFAGVLSVHTFQYSHAPVCHLATRLGFLIWDVNGRVFRNVCCGDYAQSADRRTSG